MFDGNLVFDMNSLRLIEIRSALLTLTDMGGVSLQMPLAPSHTFHMQPPTPLQSSPMPLMQGKRKAALRKES